jgi:hypothetical protein
MHASSSEAPVHSGWPALSGKRKTSDEVHF